MASSRILKKGITFRQTSFTTSLHKFRQAAATNTNSSVTTSVHTFRQSAVTNRFTSSGFHLRPTVSSFPTSTRSTLPFRSPAGYSGKGCHFHSNSHHHDSDSDSDDYDPDSPKTIDDLAETLNGLDCGIRVKSAPYPRWNVTEDDKALYITRDMSGLNEKDVKEFVEFPRGVDSFFGYRMNDFGSVLVYRGRYPPAILVIEHLGVEQPEPEKPVEGLILGIEKYIVKIELPGRFFKTFEIKMAEENQLLQLTIPKEENKSIPEISYDWVRSFKGRAKK